MADFKDIVSTMQKLNDFAKKELSKDEQGVLNTVFDVYYYSMSNRTSVFKEAPDFIEELDSFVETELSNKVAITTAVTTIALTTVLISQPALTCTRLKKVK